MLRANSGPHRDGREAAHFGQQSRAPARGRERSASLALYRSATTTGLLKVIAQDIEEGLAARKAGA